MADLRNLRRAASRQAAAVRSAEAALASGRFELDETVAVSRRATLERRIVADATRFASVYLGNELLTAISAVDPVDALASLEATHPLLLLPVRLETRFRRAGTKWLLLVRIYPDAVFFDGHEPRLTPTERAAGARYWGHPAADERAAWAELVTAFGSERGAWIRRSTAVGAVDPGDVVSPYTRGTRTDVLPDVFWCVGWRGGAEVARAHTLPVRDPLALAPDPRIAADTDGLDAASRWLVDHTEAEQAGLALTLDLGTGGGAGVDRLLVYGAKASLGPDGASSRFARLLDAHHYGTGLGLLGAGTPTNNSDSSRSAWSSQALADAARSHRIEVEPSTVDPQPGPFGVPLDDHARAAATDGGRLAAAFGISATHLAHVEGAEATSELDARAMLVGLWPGVAGYGLRQFFDRSVPEDVATVLQRHAAAWVRARGPFASMRVGHQPYGVLPVTSLARHQPAADDDGWMPTIVAAVRRFAAVWSAARSSVPRMGKGDPAKAISEILAQSPVTVGYRLRREADAQLIELLGQLAELPPAEIESLQAVQGQLTAAGMKAIGAVDASDGVLRLLGFTSTAPLTRDLVQSGGLTDTPLTDDYLTYLRTASAGQILDDTTRLNGPLLYLLLRASVLSQYLDDGLKLSESGPTREEMLDRFLVVDIARKGPHDLLRDLLAGPVPTGPTPPIGVEDVLTLAVERVGDSPTILHEWNLGGGTTVVGHDGQVVWPPTVGDDGRVSFVPGMVTDRPGAPRPGADDSGPGPPGVASTSYAATAAPGAGDASAPTVAPRIISAPTGSGVLERLHTIDAVTLETPLGIVDVAAALAHLATLSTRSLDRLLRETLDLGAHRLDAWITSLATERLAELRHDNPTGLHLGAYSWVHDLRPAASGSSGGFVHAPSVGHAVTASVLRSAHLARGGTDELAIDLSSKRVRIAQRILDGVRAGGRMGALLGAVFEEELSARQAQAAIGPARVAAPLAGSVGAGRVPGGLDGETLLGEVEAGRVTAAGLAAASGVPAGDRSKVAAAVTAALTALADASDAIGDLLLAESVHQLASHNLPRAVAAMAAASGGPPLDRYDVTRIGPPGVGVTMRLAVMHRGAVPVPTREGVRAVLDPFVDAWLGTVLGPLDDIGVDVVFDDDTKETITLADLGLHATDVVALVGTVASSTGEVGVPLVRLMEGAAAAAAAGQRRKLVTADVSEIDDIVPIARTLAQLLANARPSDPDDLPTAFVTAGVVYDPSALRARVVDGLGVVEAAIKSAETAMGARAARAEPSELRDALLGIVRAGVISAVPVVVAGDENETARLTEEVARGRDELARRRDAAVEALARPAASANPPATATGNEVITALRAAAAALVGEQVLLTVSVSSPLLDASFTQRPTVSGAKGQKARERAARAVLHDLAAVREPVGHVRRLRQLLQGRGAAPPAVDLLQLTGTPVADEPWAGDGDPTRSAPAAAVAGGRISMLAVSSGLADTAGAPVVGLVLDEWTEDVPAPTLTSALAVHANRPSNEAPQAILLAVPPDPAAGWDQGVLEAILTETIELAEMRAVDLPALGSLGQIVPMLHVPLAGLSFNKEVQWFDLTH